MIRCLGAVHPARGSGIDRLGRTAATANPTALERHRPRRLMCDSCTPAQESLIGAATRARNYSPVSPCADAGHKGAGREADQESQSLGFGMAALGSTALVTQMSVIALTYFPPNEISEKLGVGQGLRGEVASSIGQQVSRIPQRERAARKARIVPPAAAR